MPLSLILSHKKVYVLTCKISGVESSQSQCQSKFQQSSVSKRRKSKAMKQKATAHVIQEETEKVPGNYFLFRCPPSPETSSTSFNWFRLPPKRVTLQGFVAVKARLALHPASKTPAEMWDMHAFRLT